MKIEVTRAQARTLADMSESREDSLRDAAAFTRRAHEAAFSGAAREYRALTIMLKDAVYHDEMRAGVFQ